MRVPIQISFSCLLALVISACTNKPVFTVEILASPTPVIAAVNHDFATPTQLEALPLVPTNTAIPAPLVTPTEVFPTTTDASAGEPFSLPTKAVTQFVASGFSPVLYGKNYGASTFFLLLGGVQGNTWLTAEQSAAQFGGEWEYDVHTFANGSFQVHGHVPEFSPTSRDYAIGTNSTRNDHGMVGVLHGWNVRQGTAQEISADQDSYRNVVLEWLAAQGVSDPKLGELRIFRVDLEADGVDEVFISATRLDGQHITRAGDYSIVLMRKVTGNSVVTIPLAADVYHSQEEQITYPAAYSLGNFIDLNRDGILEVVIDRVSWERFGAFVYQVDGQTVSAVFR